MRQKIEKEDKLAKAISLGLEYGQAEGERHSRWVIDQMLRILLDKDYQKTIDKLNKDNSDCEPWDCGIAP